MGVEKECKICGLKSLVKRDWGGGKMNKKVRDEWMFLVFARSKKMGMIQFFGSGKFGWDFYSKWWVSTELRIKDF